MKKIVQTREQPMLARLRELNWQTSGKESAPICEEDFAFHIFNMAQNNNDRKTLQVVCFQWLWKNLL